MDTSTHAKNIPTSAQVLLANVALTSLKFTDDQLRAIAECNDDYPAGGPNRRTGNGLCQYARGACSRELASYDIWSALEGVGLVPIHASRWPGPRPERIEWARKLSALLHNVVAYRAMFNQSVR